MRLQVAASTELLLTPT